MTNRRIVESDSSNSEMFGALSLSRIFKDQSINQPSSQESINRILQPPNRVSKTKYSIDRMQALQRQSIGDSSNMVQSRLSLLPSYQNYQTENQRSSFAFPQIGSSLNQDRQQPMQKISEKEELDDEEENMLEITFDSKLMKKNSRGQSSPMFKNKTIGVPLHRMETAMDLLDTQSSGNELGIYKEYLRQALQRQVSLKECDLLFSKIRDMYQSKHFDSKQIDQFESKQLKIKSEFKDHEIQIAVLVDDLGLSFRQDLDKNRVHDISWMLLMDSTSRLHQLTEYKLQEVIIDNQQSLLSVDLGQQIQIEMLKIANTEELIKKQQAEVGSLKELNKKLIYVERLIARVGYTLKHVSGTSFEYSFKGREQDEFVFNVKMEQNGVDQISRCRLLKDKSFCENHPSLMQVLDHSIKSNAEGMRMSDFTEKVILLIDRATYAEEPEEGFGKLI